MIMFIVIVWIINVLKAEAFTKIVEEFRKLKQKVHFEGW